MSKVKQIIPGSGWDLSEWIGVITVILGVALITVGITFWVKEGLHRGLIYVIGGALAIILPFAIAIINMNRGAIKYEYPTAENRKLSAGEHIETALFLLAFACLLIGFGVALSSAFITLKYGWDFAQYFLIYGLLGAGAPMVLFIVLGSIFIK